MTRLTGQSRRFRAGWRRAVTGSVLAAGLLAGVGAPVALADDTDPTAAAGAAPAMTADQALAIIAADYDTGAGGGQLSQLIHEVLTLRAHGFYPSNANKQAIVNALDYRPNQGPLIKALQATIAYQRKIQAQTAAQPPSQIVMGVSQVPAGQQAAPANPAPAG